MVLCSLAVGVIAGLGAVVFRAMIGGFHNLLFLGRWSFDYNDNVHTPPPSAWGVWIVLVPVLGVIGGVRMKLHVFCFDLPQSDACFIKAYPAETTEAILDGHVSAFAFFGGVPSRFCMTISKSRWRDSRRRQTPAHPRLHGTMAAPRARRARSAGSDRRKMRIV